MAWRNRATYIEPLQTREIAVRSSKTGSRWSPVTEISGDGASDYAFSEFLIDWTSVRTLWAKFFSSCIARRTRVPAALLPSL